MLSIKSILTSFLLLTASLIIAQDDSKLNFGLSTGVVLSTTSKYLSQQKVGFQLGLGVSYKLNSKFSLELQPNFSLKGCNCSNDVENLTTVTDYRHNQIMFPLSIKYNIFKKINLGLGIFYAYNFNKKFYGEISNTSNLPNSGSFRTIRLEDILPKSIRDMAENTLSTNDKGLIFNLGYTLPKFSINLSYGVTFNRTYMENEYNFLEIYVAIDEERFDHQLVNRYYNNPLLNSFAHFLSITIEKPLFW